MGNGELRQKWSITTSWTLIEAAAAGEGEAWAEFYKRYSRPVCAFIERSRIVRDANDPGNARDIADDFFAKKVLGGRKGGLLRRVDSRRKFRPYLKVALKNYLVDIYRKEKRERERLVWPDGIEEGWNRIPADQSADPDLAFDLEWIRALFEIAAERTRAICKEKKQEHYFEIFRARHVDYKDKPPSWAELGTRYEMTDRQAYNCSVTAKRRFRVELWKVLKEEEQDPEGAMEELAFLGSRL